MKYPLYQNSRDELKLPSDRPIDDFSLVNLKKGNLSSEDLGIHREVLLSQARISEAAGFPQLAGNLRRAAELTEIPDRELLRIYEALRPGRMNRSSLQELAQGVEENYEAPLTARFIREAAENCMEDNTQESSGY